MMFSQLNDNEFLAKVERQFLSRKKTGTALLILSLVMIGVAIYIAYDFGDRVVRLADSISRLADNSSDEALRQKTKKTSAELSLILGEKLGFLLCGLIAAGMHSLMQALYLLFGSRKERLLIEYSRRLRGIGK